MNTKKILMYVGIALAIFILYKVLFGNSKKEGFNPYGQQAPKVKDEPIKEANVPPPVPSKDQELINEYTKQIDAGQHQGGNLYYQRGIVYLRTKQPQAAVQDFNITLKIVPNSPFVLYNRALAYMDLHEYKEAIVDLTEAIKLNPDFTDAYNTRALAYVELEYYNDALNDYAQALKLNDEFSEVYFNQGTLYMRMKKYDEAKDAFSKAISSSAAPANATPEQLAALQTKLMQAYLNLARAELTLGEYESALKDATYVVTNDPKNIEALRLRADIYDKTGNSAAAANDIATADTLGLQKMLDNGQ